MTSNITDIYNFDNFQYDRKIYKIRFIFKKNKLIMININDIFANIFKTKYEAIDLIATLKKININLDNGCLYNIKYKQKNYSGSLSLQTPNTHLGKIIDGINIID